jgi:hypothetical protein
MDLTCDQAEQINRALSPTVGYLHRLRSRMEQLVTPADPHYRLVATAFDALQHLANEMHSESCRSGVGRPPKPAG